MNLLKTLFQIHLAHPIITFYNIYYLLEGIFYKKILRRRKIWTFDNGVSFYKDQLIGFQILRYKKHNLHEPQDEKYFNKLLDLYDGRGIFIDVGAAAGYYSFLIKKRFPKIKVYAFNPSTVFAKMLEENIELNNVEGIVQIQEAISNKTGTCGISRGWGGGITSLGNIKMTTIDNFVEQEKIKDIFLVKIDIQGEEARALEGASNSFQKIRALLVESHNEATHKKCKEILLANNYKLEYAQLEVAEQPSGLIVAVKANS